MSSLPVNRKIRERKVDYGDPPLIELVCGAQFKELGGFLASHLGFLWSEFKAQGYDKVQEVPPLSPVFEKFGDTNFDDVGLNISDTPPLPRSWFINESNGLLIQIQRDRFIHNWRKANSEMEYPRYDQVFASFQKYFRVFQKFVSKLEIGEVIPNQYELTYVNRFPSFNGSLLPSQVGEAMKDVSWSDNEHRFLPNPESFRSTFSFSDSPTLSMEWNS